MSQLTDIANGPAYDAFGVTPDDNADLEKPIRALDVITGGTVTFTTRLGNNRTITVPDSYTLKCAMTKVFATGTTATGLIGYV